MQRPTLIYATVFSPGALLILKSRRVHKATKCEHFEKTVDGVSHFGKNKRFMRKNSYHILAAALVALAFPAHAGYVDITANDGGPSSGTYIVQDGPTAGQPSSDPRPGLTESGRVTASCATNASWDLRAMAYNPTTNQLMIVSGFNPLAKNFDQNVTGDIIGDIFIDINNSFTNPSRASIGIPATDGSHPYSNSSSGIGFEYAIHLNDPSHSVNGNLSYDLFALNSASVLLTSDYNQNSSSDPAFLSPTATDQIKLSGLSHVETLSDNQVFANYGINVGTNGGYNDGHTIGPDNYVFTFDLSAASLANGATFRLTEQCGNDLLVGSLPAGVAAAAVPETSTWVMGFLALGAVVFMVRRNAKTALS